MRIRVTQRDIDEGVQNGTELAAITMFIVIILKTARQSVEPHQIYEKFIFAAFIWFFVQAIVSDLLFFAKVTAVGVDQVVMRIALIDGPLRDIQLLGFGALIIAGVSQRFVPAVYGLAVVYCENAKKSGMWLNSHGVTMSGLYYPRGVLPNCCKPRVSARPFCRRLWVETTVAVR